MSPEPGISILSSILPRLACPGCRGPVEAREGGLWCAGCATAYPPCGRALDLRPRGTEARTELADWTEHWSSARQRTFSQRFFSFYRKVVFARTVAFFVNRYFPNEGVFVEAGSGTSETSIRIDKRGGRRILVAVDIVVPVVAEAHEVMDACLGGDCFHLPFADESVDGLWNVGVMEHFPRLRDRQNVGRIQARAPPRCPVLLLWPGKGSLPQRCLRVVEALSTRGGRVCFDSTLRQISQLRSANEGQQILERNGLQVIRVDPGPLSLLAFKTILSRKLAATVEGS